MLSRTPRRRVPLVLAAVLAIAMIDAGPAGAAPAELPPDTQAPSRPGQPTMVSATPHTVTLTWTPSTDDVGVVQYRVEIVSMASTPFVTSATNTVTFTDLAPGGYVFVVAAFDAAGNRSQTSAPSSGVSLPFPADPTPPTKPTGVTVSNITDTGALLSWQPSTDNYGVVKYDIWTFTPSWQLVRLGSTPTTSLQLTGLIPRTSYTIAVQAVDTHENGSDLAFIGLRTTGSLDVTPPSTPGPPSVTRVTHSSVTLTWGPSTDDRTPPRYLVYRVTATGLSFATSSDTTSQTVYNLNPDTTYSFVVIAADAAGNNSARSAPVTTRTAAAPVFGCQARYAVTSTENGGSVTSLTLTNTGTILWHGWVLKFTFPGDQQVTSMTGGTFVQRGADVTVNNTNDNYQLPPGQSLQITFDASHGADNPTPQAFTVNGIPCTLG
jgi:chitodextrinase